MCQIPSSVVFISSYSSSRPPTITLSSIFRCCWLNLGPGGHLSYFQGPAPRLPSPEPSKSFLQREPAVLMSCVSFGCAVFCQQMNMACLLNARVCARPSGQPESRQTWPLFSYFVSSSSVIQPGPIPLELEAGTLSTGLCLQTQAGIFWTGSQQHEK